MTDIVHICGFDMIMFLYRINPPDACMCRDDVICKVVSLKCVFVGGGMKSNFYNEIQLYENL